MEFVINVIKGSISLDTPAFLLMWLSMVVIYTIAKDSAIFVSRASFYIKETVFCLLRSYYCSWGWSNYQRFSPKEILFQPQKQFQQQKDPLRITSMALVLALLSVPLLSKIAKTIIWFKTVLIIMTSLELAPPAFKDTTSAQTSAIRSQLFATLTMRKQDYA